MPSIEELRNKKQKLDMDYRRVKSATGWRTILLKVVETLLKILEK